MINNLEAYQSVLHSFDGSEQRQRILHLQQAQYRLVVALNNLIVHQNERRDRKPLVTVLPHQMQSYFVHFEDESLYKVNPMRESVESNKPKLQFFQSPLASFYPLMSTEFYLRNPIQQSQDKYLFQPQQEQNHFKTEDFKFKPNQQQESDHEVELSAVSVKKIKKKPIKINDTKNITKNYSKAIISYMLQNKELCLQHLDKEIYDEFVVELKQMKNVMTNIKQLRDLWMDSEDEKQKQKNRAFRIFSKYFLKCQSVSYIYNSRISNRWWHLKYRQNLIRAINEPQNFKFIKDI